MRFLAVIGALAILFGIGAAVFFFGGYYSVAGTAEDPAAVTWALTKVRTASISRHATDSPPATTRRSRDRGGRRQRVCQLWLRQLPRRARRPMAEIFGRAASRSARPEGRRRRPLALPVVLGHQERHQHDGHAELRAGRRKGRPKSGRSWLSSRSCRPFPRPTTSAGPRRPSLQAIGRAPQPAALGRPASPAEHDDAAGDAGQHRPIAVAEIRRDADAIEGQHVDRADPQAPSAKAPSRVSRRRQAKPHTAMQASSQKPARNSGVGLSASCSETSALKAGRSGKTPSSVSRRRRSTSSDCRRRGNST